jgi:hypothetical protein
MLHKSSDALSGVRLNVPRVGSTVHGAENSVEHVKGLLLLFFLPKDPKESVMVITGGKASPSTVSNPDGGIG